MKGGKLTIEFRLGEGFFKDICREELCVVDAENENED